ncbi:motile sperm domain-containing protein 1-like isoform X2 [Choristoneura fumiferana]|uniref:motile sperm domain-containing protein 1-like isoform X2 n=1 Tax=Choristoneura fumiferana TaxID=7141 RepID=UPI003D155D84
MQPVPVFVFPDSLDFYLNARHTHKQLLTVYNPYEFPVNFKVLCTSPNKFTVIDPEGLIAPQSCIDIVVRYTQPSVAHNNSTEKFRVAMFDRNTQQPLGKKDVITKLIEGEPLYSHQESSGDNFHTLPAHTKPAKQTDDSKCTHPGPCREQQINLVAVAVSVCCIAVLMMPTRPDTAVQSQLPDWLHIGSGLKIVFAFVLGLIPAKEREDVQKRAPSCRTLSCCYRTVITERML